MLVFVSLAGAGGASCWGKEHTLFVGRRRPAVLLMVGALFGILTAAPSAQAASCTAVPGSIPGTDVTVLGTQYRVPTVSNVTVCTSSATTPWVAVDLNGYGYCSTGCFSVILQGGATDAGALSVSYRTDGVQHTESVDPSGVGGGGNICLFSVGSPDAPYPSCSIALGPDGLPNVGPLPTVPPVPTTGPLPTVPPVPTTGPLPTVPPVPTTGPLPSPPPVPTAPPVPSTPPVPTVSQIRALVDSILAGLPGCETVPDVYDANGNPHNFCQDPRGWTSTLVQAVQQFCEESCNANGIRCIATGDPRYCGSE